MKDGDAGFDMYSVERVDIPSGETYWVDSGITAAIPIGWVGLIWARSGMAYHYSVAALGGVIDSNYRGSVRIGLVNHGHKTLEIKAGERIAQLIVQPYMSESIEVKLEDLDSTDRGTNAMGSSGR